MDDKKNYNLSSTESILDFIAFAENLPTIYRYLNGLCKQNRICCAVGNTF